MAPTTLSAGDIAITGFNFDNPDEFSFVLLTDIGSGTSISFTDNGWLSSGGFRSGEGTFTWTASTDLTAGTIINPSLSSVAFSADGDQILAYQGTASSPTFIYAVNSEGSGWATDATNSNTSALPAGLTNGLTAVSIPEVDNAIYNISNGTSGTKAELLEKISNSANWTVNDTTQFTQPSGSFTVGDNSTPSLSLSVAPVSFSEAAGEAAATGTVTRTGDVTQSLTVTLASSDTSEASVAATVTIAANQTSATFDVSAIDDAIADGSQTVTLTASATNFTSGTTSVTVTDDDTAAGTTRIYDIQGAAHTSPFAGQTVSNVPGIVTAVRSNGFYLQDPNPDANDATSEGIFVFTSVAPTVTVGDSILVSGTVSEFTSGGASSGNLSTTQIGGSLTINKLSSGNPLPVATILGNGGRAIPTQVIDNDQFSAFDPAQDGIDFYESVEGMLVQVNNAVAVGPTSNFGEIPVVADNGANATTLTPRGGIIIQPGDFNPERIIIDDVLVSSEPQVNVGDKFSGAITGVIDYSFGNYKLLNTSSLPSVTSGGLTRETTTLTGTEDQLTVASFNVENLDPSDGSTKFASLANVIVNNLQAPDIISLEEIQDNNGATNDSVVDANLTYQTLIDAIATAGGPTYEYRQVNPVDDQDGGQPGGNIRVGFLFNPERVDFVDTPGGTSTTNTTVISGEEGLELSTSPGRIIDTDLSDGDAFANSRKPLVGEFVFNGNSVFVIGNHFNSKGGDQPLFGSNQPPTLTSEAQRLQQAAIVNDFVESILAEDPNANVVVMGDLNDFQFSNPLATLKGDDLTNLVDTLPLNEQYTYVFEGNSQALDHILVSDNLSTTAAAEIDIVHLNAEFADQVSDHDPLVARFTLPQANSAPVANNDTATTNEDTAVTISVLANDTDADGNTTILSETLAIATAPSNGTILVNEDGTLTYTPNLEFFGSDSFTYTVQDNQGATSNTGTVSLSVNPVVNVINGTSGNDTLNGTDKRDEINAGDKNDNLFGNAGSDKLFGEAGNDELSGGSGNDTLEGGIDNDKLYGEDGKDILTGGTGNDELTGGANDDILRGGAGNDQVTGGIGIDTFVLATGEGKDTITDFVVGTDLIGLTNNLTFGTLTITQDGNDTRISVIDTNEFLATLTGIQSNTITENAFTLV